jgi:4-hydroxy-3-methylbut-2-enyl diphosphate reductase
MQVILAEPRGFCAGVVRAIKIVEQAIQLYGMPIYVLHEIVHNRHVVEDLKRQGVLFVEVVDEVPAGAVIIFSAHGVSNAVVEQAKRRDLRIVDATCPLVTKVHLQAEKYSRQGFEIIIIGHQGHQEVEGTRGRVEGSVHIISNLAEVRDLKVSNPHRLAYVTQTTLSVDDTREVIDALKERYTVQGPELSDICYATQSRQNAVRKLAKEAELLLVVGARNSSNSNRLREVGTRSGLIAYLIEDADDLNPGWFSDKSVVGVTAGASTPEEIVQGVLEKLREYGADRVCEMEGEHETMHFSLPKFSSGSNNQSFPT